MEYPFFHCAFDPLCGPLILYCNPFQFVESEIGFLCSPYILMSVPGCTVSFWPVAWAIFPLLYILNFWVCGIYVFLLLFFWQFGQDFKFYFLNCVGGGVSGAKASGKTDFFFAEWTFRFFRGFELNITPSLYPSCCFLLFSFDL